MNRNIHEGLVNVATYLGVAGVPEYITTINDAMDEIRCLQEQLKTERENILELKKKLIRQKVRSYNE